MPFRFDESNFTLVATKKDKILTLKMLQPFLVLTETLNRNAFHRFL